MNKKLLQKAILLVTLVIGNATVNAQTKSTATRIDTAKKMAALSNKIQTPVTKTAQPATASATKPATAKADTGKNKKAALTKTTIQAKKKPSTISEGQRGQTIFAELGGPGLALSANYDFRFARKPDGWGMRLGAGYFGADGNIMISAPVQINYLLGHDSKFLELGAGGTFLKTKGNPEDSFFIFDKITGVVGTITIGYRYQPTQPGFSFRAALNPIIYNEGLIPAAGVSLGYSF